MTGDMIGSGAYDECYKAKDTLTNNIVAIKRSYGNNNTQISIE